MRTPPILLGLLVGCGPQPPDATGTFSEETFRSELVDDDYVLRVRTPAGHDPSVALPLIVQLDPTFASLQQLAWTTGLLSEGEADGSLPEAVVVGVDYPNPSTRFRDYTPTEPLDPGFATENGADRFHRVLAEEILPYIEATWGTDPARRILMGHSNGGVFGWYAAFRHAPPEPPLFTGIVAADAGIPESTFVLEGWHAERASDLPLRLYTSRALYNGAAQAIAHTALVERLEDRGFPGLDLKAETLDGDHGTVLPPSYDAGLQHVLGGDL